MLHKYLLTLSSIQYWQWQSSSSIFIYSYNETFCTVDIYRLLKLNFHYADFVTQIMTVYDKNDVADFCDSSRGLSWVVSSTKSAAFVANFPSALSQTKFHYHNTNEFVADFVAGLWPRLSMPGSFGASQRNGIWALPYQVLKVA